ncbi:uncharacterized protein Z518_11185 [Rhinocladiella mackenziei CBS 650.93]|uniref:Fungal-type protein kinase domain-containing protein n=1 Tax=Rhinocladiella mackenziei CBS 650.93 TaxID=1442369 RepID=A0A0D2FBI0_9EURO|nr:uncharacterized protein Z518_11185 [Rhinocladiella mackenziei CBS 650.93]KIW99446.1 hypothetical protein Z518_11185 [Rhinocladiella mackenziei CBS 650.93]
MALIISEILQNNPIGNALDAFRDAYSLTCEKLELPPSTDALGQISEKKFQSLAVQLIVTLQLLSASLLLPSRTGRGLLVADLSSLIPAVVSKHLDIERIVPLLRVVINKEPDDIIFEKAYAAVVEPTPPPPPPRAHILFQTPHKHSTSSIVNTSEHRKFMDDLLKEEIGPLYTDIPGFYEAFYGKVPHLKENAETVFQKCPKGDTPLYHKKTGWRDWPIGAKEEDVIRQPNNPLEGSTAERKPDICFVDDPNGKEDSTYHWSRILVPGEPKRNPCHDMATATWLDLARYVREVLAAQDTRRFVLGFTLCGSIMRLWEFDRVGGIASTPFNINRDGLQFVSVVLGFLWTGNEQLGFDPTVVESNGIRYMKITRNGQPERLVLETLMKRATSVIGRATTCWKAYRDGDESRTPLVVKDSWQFSERDEEGE